MSIGCIGKQKIMTGTNGCILQEKEWAKITVMHVLEQDMRDCILVTPDIIGRHVGDASWVSRRSRNHHVGQSV